MNIQNPWRELDFSKGYVLPQDMPIVEKLTKRTDVFRVDTRAPPDPFLGNPEAPIVFLTLNPSFNEEEVSFWKNNSLLLKINHDNLLHKHKTIYYFDDKFKGHGGHAYWKDEKESKLRHLIKIFGPEIVSKSIFIVEFFPYHSEKYKVSDKVPRQDYSFHLIREAMKRKAVIVIMRSKQYWFEAIPELKDYGCYFLNSVQNTDFTQNNCPEGWKAVVETIKKSVKKA